jgi:hypothetical protein
VDNQFSVTDEIEQFLHNFGESSSISLSGFRKR